MRGHFIVNEKAETEIERCRSIIWKEGQTGRHIQRGKVIRKV